LIFRAVEDTDLIRQASRGSVESYNLLVSRWEKRVYNYLLRITGNREDALDLLARPTQPGSWMTPSPQQIGSLAFA